jgi:undecaprenyl-diphosphatase
MNAIDAAVEQGVGRIQQAGLYDAFHAVTHLGDGWVLAAITFAGVAASLALRNGRTATILAMTLLLSLVASTTAKAAVGRERPNVAWRTVALPGNASFPSGHALESTAAYGALALLAARRLRRRVASLALLAGAFIVVALIGVSRVYLGVHYFTDVVVGWGLGLALALTAWWIDRRKGRLAALPPDVLADVRVEPVESA